MFMVVVERGFRESSLFFFFFLASSSSPSFLQRTENDDHGTVSTPWDLEASSSCIKGSSARRQGG